MEANRVLQSGPVIGMQIPDPRVITISGVPNADYRIESTENLAASGPWNLEHEFHLEDEMTYNWAAPDMSSGTRFYRIMVEE